MMTIRPVETGDLMDILSLADKTGAGLTSLPTHRDVLAARIDRSIRTWQGTAERGEQGYLFVLEDSERHKVVGVSAIEAAVGLNEPWYNFRVGTLVHASKSLNVYKAVPTLYLSNDHTGQSELCTLFLDPDYRHGNNGHLLMKARLLFMAAFRQHFSPRVIAELRGYCDEQGNSPFWANLGQHFFSMDFSQADYLSGTGSKAFIAELMPKHPLYVDFLAPEARAAIAKVHPHTEPARAVLESEGLRYQGYIDIFDGGPILEAEIDTVRTVRECRLWVPGVSDGSGPERDAPWFLLANDDYRDYRVVSAQPRFEQDRLIIGADVYASLGLSPGRQVRAVPVRASSGTSKAAL
ncbi:arginine N-succinyltransferase [Sodalis sp. dw_96]|uniref:arginine N-succinyltransferase n=1 Tax=Sodalis sp. dw_96 TaxID=2719794 RepID=UPI001BD2D356|nr:arginine N-succinyltransferase [Sodalis sp. dw_96]